MKTNLKSNIPLSEMDQRSKERKPVTRRKLRKKKVSKRESIKSKSNHLTREVQRGRAIVKRHEQSWKAILLKITLPEERLKAELVWQSWERLADAKDFTISLLLDELREAQDQKIYLYSSGIQNIQKLMDLLKIEMENMNGSFYDSVEELKNQIRTERELTKETLATTFHQHVMIFGLEKQKKELEENFEVMIKHVLQDREMMFQKELYLDKYEKEQIIKNTMAIGQDAFNEYHSYITPKRTKFEQAVEVDKIGRNIIKRRVIKIKHMLKRISVMKYNYNMTNSSLSTEKNNILLRKNFIRDGLLTLRNLQRNTFQIEVGNMRKLVIASDGLIEKLGAMENKGEKILKMMNVCRNLETTEEAILAIPLEKPCSGNDNTEYSKENILKTFFAKVGKADEKRADLIAERNYLKTENLELRKKIQEYCKCLNCPPIIVTKKNSSLTMPNVTDGSEATRKYNMKARTTVRWDKYVVE